MTTEKFTVEVKELWCRFNEVELPAGNVVGTRRVPSAVCPRTFCDGRHTACAYYITDGTRPATGCPVPATFDEARQ